jgi:hypothetical protein
MAGWIFLLTFVICPILWLWAKATYNPQTMTYGNPEPARSPVPPTLKYDRQVEERKRLREWQQDFDRFAREAESH